MRHGPPRPGSDTEWVPRIPSWVNASRVEAIDDAAFFSGAALGALHPLVAVRREDLPQALLRERLALSAAEACLKLAGRPERAAELRDEVHLVRPGESLGPAGRVFALWRAAVRGPVTGRGLAAVLPAGAASHVLVRPGAPGAGPVGRAAAVLEGMLDEAPGDESAALIATDAVLARALGWPQLVPLLVAGLTGRALRGRGEDLCRSCHRAVTASAIEAVRMAAELGRRAERLRAVAPKLRARGAGEAVRLFLSRDALAPSIALTGPRVAMSDRAARRLCDRLVELGAVRELTGRASFRLYGL